MIFNNHITISDEKKEKKNIQTRVQRSLLFYGFRHTSSLTHGDILFVVRKITLNYLVDFRTMCNQ